jgi:thymidylate synthase
VISVAKSKIQNLEELATMNIVDRTYLDLLDRILAEGSTETNRTGTDTISLFGVSYRLPVSTQAFPILTHKKIQWRSLVVEMIWYLSGESHIRNLQKYTKIWDSWSDDRGNLETAYGRFWRYYPVPAYDRNIRTDGSNYLINGEASIDLDSSKYQHILTIDSGDEQIDIPCFDQLRWVIDELKRNPRSRRLHVTAWYPPNATMSRLPPCHHSFTLNYQGGKLNLHLQQRSSDHCVGNPFNLTCYSLLLLLICREVNLEPGDFYHSITDAHIYVDHIEPYRAVDRDISFPLPQLDLTGLGDRSMFALTYDDIDRIQLVNYQHGAFVKLPVAV